MAARKSSASKPQGTQSIPLDRARVHWWHRQGLAAPGARNADQSLIDTGWIRTVGGVEVYLGVRVRVPGLTRGDIDAAAAAREVAVVPAVRGCMYLLPRERVGPAMRFARGIWEKRTVRDLEKTGTTWKEVEKLAAQVIQVLDKPLTTDAIRRALPDGAVRSLGEKGKKVGMSSLLPLALRSLEFDAKIERANEGGRLDSERYTWGRAKGKPAAQEKGDPLIILARIFSSQMGATSIGDFAEWAGVSRTQAIAAIDQLDTVAVAIERYADDARVLREHLDELKHADPNGTFALLGFEDNASSIHGPVSVLTHPAHHKLMVPTWGSAKRSSLGEARHTAWRTIMVDGEIVGFWEFDPDKKTIVMGWLQNVPQKLRARISEKADELRSFLVELGHAHFAVLDTDDALRERCDEIRAL